MQVSVIGSGVITPQDPRYSLAVELGTALVDAGHRIVCGGLGGVMMAAAQGAHASASHRKDSVVGLLPGRDAAAANPYIDIAIPTGLGDLRNGLIAQSDAVVAIGGGAGTLSEIALAWINDRIVIAYRVDGWSGHLADTRLDDRVRFPDRPDDRIYGVASAAEVIALLEDLSA